MMRSSRILTSTCLCIPVLKTSRSASSLLLARNHSGVRMVENSSVRTHFGYSCYIADALLVGFVSETATFIAECGEDENDTVVKESFRLKDAVENVAGKIDGL